MAIQLNERDELIFSLIEEHKVLLEKHIAWFISSDVKPVLIRDRLRKLFYLDYLLCQRHPGTLPWWTTPTKPLVYTLSPLTRQIVGLGSLEIDIDDTVLQRHLLEIANLRMLFLIAQKDGQLLDFRWTTCSMQKNQSQHIDALVNFNHNGTSHLVGILNHPVCSTEVLIEKIQGALTDDRVDTVMLVSRDDDQQNAFQRVIGTQASVRLRCAFSTHQQLYKAGIIKAGWENADGNQSAIFLDGVLETKNWTPGMVKARPATA